MEPEKRDQIIRIWEEFADNGYRYVNSKGDIQSIEEVRAQRQSHIEERRDILRSFLDGDRDLNSFKHEMDSMASSNQLWGYKGTNGALFFNLLVSEAGPELDLPNLLREVLAAPDDSSSAAPKIRQLVEAVEDIRSTSDSLQKAPKLGSIPYFVSYYWQLQSPDQYPVYYVSMKEALFDLGIWEPSGKPAEDYIEFWELNEEIRGLLEDHTGEDIHLWTIERLCLFYNGRDQLDSSVSLPEQQVAILHEWENAASTIGYAKHFKFEGDYTPEMARKRADEFVESPGKETFFELWDTMHGAQRAGSASSIYEKWTEQFGRTDSELAEVINEIRQADTYNSSWENELGAQRTVWELFGLLHIENYPIMNGSAERGLEFFGYDRPNTYEELSDQFSSFKENYQSAVGHVTAGTDHEVPINFEIDQLLNVIDKVADGDPENEDHQAAATLYQKVLEVKEGAQPGESNYFWITANPSIWKVQSIDDGQEVFYTAYNQEGNKRRIFAAFEQANPGDKVVFYESTPTKAIVAEGEIVEGLHEEEEESHEGPVEGVTIRYNRPVNEISWSQLTDVQDLEESSPIRNAAQGSLFPLSKEEYETILALEELIEEPDLGEGIPLSPVPEEPTGAKTIERQLRFANQLVFHGPPGTGKTYTAQRFARWWISRETTDPTENQVEVVTFHPSFTYEDFIEGLTAEARDGGVEYRIQDGVFKRVCNRARRNYQNGGRTDPYVLIIDEINRGNLAQIFGETITLLEPDKRLGAENQTVTTLPHSKERFTIPPNVYLIGTMNTADRSIALVDAALRRRFRFMAFPPKSDVLYQEYGFDGARDVEDEAVSGTDPVRQLIALSILGLESLNESIRDSGNLGKGNQIGHSYLIGIDDGDSVEDQLRSVTDAWKYEILPLIEEYFFSQFDRIQQELFDGTGGRLFDWDHEQIKDFGPDDLASTLIPLTNTTATWTGLDRESGETVFTYNYLLQENLLQNGDQLVFDPEKIPEDAIRTYDETDPFWNCEVTGNTGQQDNVRWGENQELYSLTGLAKTILEEISDHEGPVEGPRFWLHPRFENKRLTTLKDEHQSGQLKTGRGTTRESLDE